ncbi:MAG: hypothetical protein F6K48_25600 [Okeania sp. SIO3H1]|nr:hypothetical protein [Okeania sp. SIO3H1]
MGEGRRQETGDNPPLAPPPPRRGGEDRRNGNERGSRSKNFPLIFLPNSGLKC